MLGVGLLLLTNLTAATDMPMLWLWMFVTGLGVGPTLSVFTIVIQASVPFSRLGVATGNLTFFRVYSGVLNSGDTILNPVKGRKERIVPVTGRALEALHVYLRHRSDLLAEKGGGGAGALFDGFNLFDGFEEARREAGRFLADAPDHPDALEAERFLGAGAGPC